MTEVWKVVGVDGDGNMSSIAAPHHSSVTYEIGEEPGSALMAFDTKERAENYAYGEEGERRNPCTAVLRCSAVLSDRGPDRLKPINATRAEFEAVVWRKALFEIVWRKDAPAGTVFCESITPLGVVR